MLRLFVALPLPSVIIQRLVGLQAGLPGARWVPPENFHLTLRYVGEVDEGGAEDIDAALDLIAAPAFELTLDGLGHFGSGHRQRTLWAGVAPSPALLHLQGKVESALVRAGRAPETRKFSPHVTLARLDDTAPERLGRYLAANGLFRTGPLPVDEFCLYDSILGKGPPAYHRLRDYPLGGWAPGEGPHGNGPATAGDAAP